MNNEQWVEQTYSSLEGKKVLEVRQMTPKELDLYGWDDVHPAIVIVFEGKYGKTQALVVSQDEEGNGPGALFLEEARIVA
jgi:hypothetical protein